MYVAKINMLQYYNWVPHAEKISRAFIPANMYPDISNLD